MNLNEYIQVLQDLADRGHGDLPVCIGDGLADIYMQEVSKLPELEEGNYSASDDGSYAYHTGYYINLRPD